MKDKLLTFVATTKLGQFIFLFLFSVLFELFLLTISLNIFISTVTGSFFTALVLAATDRKCQKWI